MLLFLPLTVSVNDALTKTIEKFGWYTWIQKTIIPWQLRLLGVMVKPLGIKFVAFQDGFQANDSFARFSWNCLGWQSLVLFLISLPFGFKAGNYNLVSKITALLIGIIGTFWINLFRVVLIVIILVVSKPLFAIVFHEYLAAVMTIVWLFFFWWFSYSFVLESKEAIVQEKASKV